MTSRPIRGLITFALMGAALAQAGAQDPRIGTRLDAPSITALRALVDSARDRRVSVGPGNPDHFVIGEPKAEPTIRGRVEPQDDSLRDGDGDGALRPPP